MAGTETTDWARDASTDGLALRQPFDPYRYVVKVNATSAITGLMFFSLAVGFVWWMFEPYVPAAIMQPWLWGSIAFLLIWLAFDIVFLIRRSGDRELVLV